MRVIIAGGRDFKPSDQHWKALDLVLSDQAIPDITEVVSGKCPTGADRFGECWASTILIKVKEFPADWKAYGRAAGPIRNGRMADYADALIAFPGGGGTSDMITKAKERGLPILKIDQEGNWDTTDWRADGQV